MFELIIYITVIILIQTAVVSVLYDKLNYQYTFHDFIYDPTSSKVYYNEDGEILEFVSDEDCFEYSVHTGAHHDLIQRIRWIKKINKRLRSHGNPYVINPKNCHLSVKELKQIHKDGKIYTKAISKTNIVDTLNPRDLNNETPHTVSDLHKQGA